MHTERVSNRSQYILAPTIARLFGMCALRPIGHRVIAARMPRVTATHPLYTQPGSPRRAEALDCLPGVFRTTWHVPAGGWCQGREKKLVEADRSQGHCPEHIYRRPRLVTHHVHAGSARIIRPPPARHLPVVTVEYPRGRIHRPGWGCPCHPVPADRP